MEDTGKDRGEDTVQDTGHRGTFSLPAQAPSFFAQRRAGYREMVGTNSEKRATEAQNMGDYFLYAQKTACAQSAISSSSYAYRYSHL